MKSTSLYCNICGAQGVSSLGMFSNYNSSALYCGSCDTFFPETFPTELEIAAYYQGYNFNAPGGTRLFKWYNRKLFEAKCRRILRRIRKHTSGKTILDFGGGSGFFSLGFLHAGYQAKIYEIDQSALEIAKRNGVEPRQSATEIFDIVFSSHVIEHFTNLHFFFNQVSQHLIHDGILVVACPNKNSQEWYRKGHAISYQKLLPQIPFLSFKQNPWFCLDPPRHNYAISFSTVQHLAKQHGFDILEEFSEYSNMGSFYHNNQYSLLNIKQFLRNPFVFFNSLYVTVLSAIMTLINPRGGENLVVILKKKHQ